MIGVFVGFYAYINKMHGSKNKIAIKNLARQRCAKGTNFGVKGLNFTLEEATKVQIGSRFIAVLYF
jgi:hypothetical protein